MNLFQLPREFQGFYFTFMFKVSFLSEKQVLRRFFILHLNVQLFYQFLKLKSTFFHYFTLCIYPISVYTCCVKLFLKHQLCYGKLFDYYLISIILDDFNKAVNRYFYFNILAMCYTSEIWSDFTKFHQVRFWKTLYLVWLIFIRTGTLVKHTKLTSERDYIVNYSIQNMLIYRNIWNMIIYIVLSCSSGFYSLIFYSLFFTHFGDLSLSSQKITHRYHILIYECPAWFHFCQFSFKLKISHISLVLEVLIFICFYIPFLSFLLHGWLGSWGGWPLKSSSCLVISCSFFFLVFPPIYALCLQALHFLDPASLLAIRLFIRTITCFRQIKNQN